MKSDYRPFTGLFGYSRRERRASLFLLLIILVISFVRYLVPESPTDIKDLTDIYFPGTGFPVQSDDTTGFKKGTLLLDPNTATYGELIKAGLGSRQARTLISYRNSGGRFRKEEDIGKIYGISQEKADSLKPFIRITPGMTEEKAPGGQVAKTVHKPFDINTCDTVELESLPGIGRVLAARIIKFRNLLGGYYAVEQLKEVYGLPEETYNRIREMVRADTSCIERISINSADYRMLSRIIYLDRYEKNAILKYRNLMDSIHSIGELVENKVIPEEKADKVRHYISFD